MFSSRKSIIRYCYIPNVRNLISSLYSSREVLVQDANNQEELFGGKLYGTVSPTSAVWAIAEDDPTNRFRGKRLIISLEKTHGYRDIWGSALLL